MWPSVAKCGQVWPSVARCGHSGGAIHYDPYTTHPLAHPPSPFRLHGIRFVAFKSADVAKSKEIVSMLEDEVHAYDDLFELQGGCLPELVDCGFALGGMVFFLATSQVPGTTLRDAAEGAVTAAQLASALEVRTCTT